MGGKLDVDTVVTCPDPAVVLLGAVDVDCFLVAPLQVGVILGPGFVKL